jgi:chemotaxis protein histidine kinase CheA
MTDKNNQPDLMIELPNDLQKKAPLVKNGGVDHNTIEQAQSIVASMKDDYLTWVQEDLHNLDAAFARLTQERTRQTIDELFLIVHDMKGQGGSFGYSLITAVGNGLCRYLERQSAVTDQLINITEVHINALHLIIDNRMTDEHAAEARQMLHGLTEIVTKNLKK